MVSSPESVTSQLCDLGQDLNLSELNFVICKMCKLLPNLKSGWEK